MLLLSFANDSQRRCLILAHGANEFGELIGTDKALIVDGREHIVFLDPSRRSRAVGNHFAHQQSKAFRQTELRRHFHRQIRSDHAQERVGSAMFVLHERPAWRFFLHGPDRRFVRPAPAARWLGTGPRSSGPSPGLAYGPRSGSPAGGVKGPPRRPFSGR